MHFMSQLPLNAFISFLKGAIRQSGVGCWTTPGIIDREQHHVESASGNINISPSVDIGLTPGIEIIRGVETGNNFINCIRRALARIARVSIAHARLRDLSSVGTTATSYLGGVCRTAGGHGEFVDALALWPGQAVVRIEIAAGVSFIGRR